jgi:hypothetical protein
MIPRKSVLPRTAMCCFSVCVMLPIFTTEMALSRTARAATLYVDSQLSGDCQGTYSVVNRDCSGSDGDAYNTIQEAASVAVAGDVVLIREGTYSEQFRPANSGSPAGHITFKNYGDETVTIVTGSAIAIDISDRSYLIIEGLRVDDSRWLEARNSHYNIIRNNSFTRSQASGTTGNVRFISSSHNRILNNVIWDGNDNLLLIDSRYNLVEGNRISEGRHSIWGIRCGDHNVIRDNFFSNTQQKIGEIYDCGEDTSAVPNSFDSTQYNLLEGNSFYRTGNSDNSSPYAGLQCAGQNTIIRRNRFYRTIGPALSLTYYSDEALNDYGNKVYHNVLYASDFAGVSIDDSSALYGNVLKNNILAQSLFVANDTRWSWYTQDLAGKPVQLMTGRIGGFVFENNSLYSVQNREDHLITHGTRFDDYLTPPRILSWWQANYPSVFMGNVAVTPRFADADANDFRLQSDSPMVDAGAFLTHTASAGNGTVMQVVDAGYFYDGFGIAGEIGDLIQLDGQTDRARIVNADYDAHTLTLDRALTWTAGQGIALAYSGSAPDMGAFEYHEVNQVYRFWSPANSRHFYTIDAAEREYVINTYPPTIWTYETVAYRAFVDEGDVGVLPVYRFWSPRHKGHFYTISEGEKDHILATYPATVWTYEGVAFYAYPDGSQPAGTSPVYRFWSSSLGAHFYTNSETEKDYVVASLTVWQCEGIAWFAYEP